MKYLAFLLVCVPLSALAASPEEIQADCQARYSSLAAAQACYNKERFDAIDGRLDGIERSIGGIEETLEELRDRQPAPQTAPVASAPAPSRATMQVGGVSYEVVARPSLVSVHSGLLKKEAHTLHVMSLAHPDSFLRCGGVMSAARVLVTNHGIPVPVWAPEGASSGFVEAYVDMDGDGQPDPVAYKTLDPRDQDDVYVTWRSGDDLRFIYLRDSGDVVTVPGRPLQTLWRPADSEDATPRACRPATTDRPGGHRPAQAYDLWPVR